MPDLAARLSRTIHFSSTFGVGRLGDACPDLARLGDQAEPDPRVLTFVDPDDHLHVYVFSAAGWEALRRALHASSEIVLAPSSEIALAPGMLSI